MIYNKGFGNVPGILNGPSDPITGPPIVGHSSSGAYVDAPPQGAAVSPPGPITPTLQELLASTGFTNQQLLIGGAVVALLVWAYFQRGKL